MSQTKQIIIGIIISIIMGIGLYVMQQDERLNQVLTSCMGTISNIEECKNLYK